MVKVPVKFARQPRLILINALVLIDDDKLVLGEQLRDGPTAFLSVQGARPSYSKRTGWAEATAGS
jgi:hypothetical protein